SCARLRRIYEPPAHAGQGVSAPEAAQLRPILEKIDGFISIERFESLTEPGKILSLSFFRDEVAVQAWRATNEHRLAQVKDGEIFDDYTRRVAGVVRDYGMHERAQLPNDSRSVHGV